MTERQQDAGPQSGNSGTTGGQSSGRDGIRDDVRRKAIEAYDGARSSVSDAGRRAGDAIDEAPLIALAGGLAAGALIAALLPRSQRESELLRPVGEKLSGTARTAANAARDAGKQRLDELGLTPDKGVETLRSILQGAGDAARTSAQAAVGAVRSE